MFRPATVLTERLNTMPANELWGPSRRTQAVIVTRSLFRSMAGMRTRSLTPSKVTEVPSAGVAPGWSRAGPPRYSASRSPAESAATVPLASSSFQCPWSAKLNCQTWPRTVVPPLSSSTRQKYSMPELGLGGVNSVPSWLPWNSAAAVVASRTAA